MMQSIASNQFRFLAAPSLVASPPAMSQFPPRLRASLSLLLSSLGLSSLESLINSSVCPLLLGIVLPLSLRNCLKDSYAVLNQACTVLVFRKNRQELPEPPFPLIPALLLQI